MNVLASVLGAIALGAVVSTAVPTQMKMRFAQDWRDRYGVSFDLSASTYYVETAPQDLDPFPMPMPQLTADEPLPPDPYDHREWLEGPDADLDQYATGYETDAHYQPTIYDSATPGPSISMETEAPAPMTVIYPAATSQEPLKVDRKAEAAAAAAAKRASDAHLAATELSRTAGQQSEDYSPPL